VTNQELVNGALIRLGLVAPCEESARTKLEGAYVVHWHSPRFGYRGGRVVMSDGSQWFLVVSEPKEALTWVQAGF
jgi:hypothetical protein